VSADRRPLVAGNWKMHPSDRASAVALARGVAGATPDVPVTVVVCPPAIWLRAVASAVRGSGVAVGAQNMHAEDAGAFTGEISPAMVAEVASYVIVGHSERRRFAGETDEEVGRKVASAVRHGLIPIAAIGETAAERTAGDTEMVIDRQLAAAIADLERIAGTDLVIAYEPVWAIGTGNAASPEDAQCAAERIRARLTDVDAEGAGEVRILYGGSVDASSAASFFAEPDVDGALVGSASLDAATFGAIARAAAR
jgi:triosephosphate isomerase